MPRHALLTAEEHRDLRVRTERGAELGDGVMSCLVVPAEFRRVQAHYPILFRLDRATESFGALALFGFDAGENLFLEDGRWGADYVPLAVAIQPFLIGGPPSGGGERRQVHVDLDSPRIGAGEGTRLFDEQGRPTPYLEGVSENLGALHEGWRGANAFFAALRRYELLEPLTLEITLDDGSTNRLVGYHVIDEAKLRSLDAAALDELHRGEHLMPIFMALASLAQLPGLIARKNRRQSR